MGELELEYVKEAFATNWIAPLGPHVNAFEKDLEQFLENGTHVAALSSGTAAIHLALVLLGVKAGDEVLCQSMTFSASANPIVYQGAIPVFIDSEETTWNMSPEFLELAIQERLKDGKKPKAIIVVHLYGMPAQIDKIKDIADYYEIPIIEDAAEALGSSYKGRALGTFGEIGILSFNGNKIITTSGGGALVSQKEEYIRKARYLATQALDPAPHYQHSEIGYNYRMSNVCAGIGRGQMKVLPNRIEQRRNNFNFYKTAFQAAEEITLAEEPNEHFYSNHWLTTVLIDGASVSREDIRLSLVSDNIDSRPVWKPMHLQPVFSDAPYYGNGTSNIIFEKGLCLPSGSNLSEEDLSRVVRNIQQVLQVRNRPEFVK
jgi:dTDP-4-amino-4,6-dideoxygalactose transaminase